MSGYIHLVLNKTWNSISQTYCTTCFIYLRICSNRQTNSEKMTTSCKNTYFVMLYNKNILKKYRKNVNSNRSSFSIRNV